MEAKTKKWLGIGLIAVPLPLLLFILSSYAISSFVISAIATPEVAGSATSGELAALIGNIINVVLGLLGIVAVVGIMIGIPLGILLLVQSGDDPKTKKQLEKDLKKNPHYNGNYSKVMKEKEKTLKKNPHYNS